MSIASAATLARKIARALDEYADELLAEASVEVFVAEDDAEAVEQGLGPRQRQIVDVLREADAGGVKTAQVADRINYDHANSYSALMGLRRRGVAELVPGSDPQRCVLLRAFERRSPT